VGAVYHSLEIVRLGAPPAGATAGTWAKEIAQHAKGLMEPLKVLEVDADDNKALIRSDKPTMKGAQAHYYEAVVTGTDKAEFKRYKMEPASETPRESIPFALTHEAAAGIVRACTVK
jgi:hypothetical protein